MYTRDGSWNIIEEHSVMVEIEQSEYDEMIEEINLLQELLAEANTKLNDPDFNKPVQCYTVDDWLKAVAGGWEFEDHSGRVFNLIGYDYSDIYPVDAAHTCFTIEGKYTNDGNSCLDIKRRVK